MTEPAKYLTTKQVAQMLEVSEDLLYRLRKKRSGGPPWQRIGGRIRYPRPALEEWDRDSTHP